MDPGEQITGTRDEQYNLISVLYHALHGAETIDTYIVDAETTGDERLLAFFREAQATHRQLAERAKGLLGIHEASPGAGIAPGTGPIGSTEPEVGMTPEDMSGGIPGEEGGISPEGMAGGIPPPDVEGDPDTPAGEGDGPVSEVSPEDVEAGGVSASAIGEIPPEGSVSTE